LSLIKNLAKKNPINNILKIILIDINLNNCIEQQYKESHLTSIKKKFINAN